MASGGPSYFLPVAGIVLSPITRSSVWVPVGLANSQTLSGSYLSIVLVLVLVLLLVLVLVLVLVLL